MTLLFLILIKNIIIFFNIITQNFFLFFLFLTLDNLFLLCYTLLTKEKEVLKDVRDIFSDKRTGFIYLRRI